MNALADIQGPSSALPEPLLPDIQPEDDDMEWETLPDDLQDNEVFTQAMRDLMDSQYVSFCTIHVQLIHIGNCRYSTRSYKDNRTWRQRIRRLHENWEPCLSDMATAFLKWKYDPDNTSALPDSHEDSFHFVIEALDIYTLAKNTAILRTADSKSVAESLMLHGYVGNSPLKPSLAVSVRTLELFRRIRLRKASFSVEAFAKVLCDLYNVSVFLC